MKKAPALLSTVALLTLTVGLVLAWCNPCTGYEPDVYAATPLLFWIGIFVCYLVGTGLVLYSTFGGGASRDTKIIGYLQLALAALSMISVCIIRGYKLMDVSGDTGTHIGRLNSVIMDGVLPNTYYPSIYSEPAVFSLVTGVDSHTVLSLFPIISMCIMTLALCLIARRVFPHVGEVCFASIVAFFIPMGSVYFIGAHNLYYAGITISMFALLPIVLLLILLCLQGIKGIFVTLIFLNIAIATYHPHVTVICLSIYAMFVFFAGIHCLMGKTLVRKSSLIKLVSLFLVMIGGFFTFTWSYFSNTIMSGINKVLSLFSPSVTPVDPVTPVTPVDLVTPVTSGGDPIISHINNLLGNVVSYFGDLLNIQLLNTAVEYGLVRVDTLLSIGGLYVILYGMFILAGFLLLFKYWKDERYFWIKVLYFSSCIMFAIMFVAIFGNVSGGPFRFRYPIYFLAVLSSGMILYNIYLKITYVGKKRFIMSIGTIFLILALICSMSIAYYHMSPRTMSGSYQTTQAELTGAETLLPLIGYDFSSTTSVHFRGMVRYVTAFYNHLDLPYRNDAAEIDDGLPPHFGYDTGVASVVDVMPDGEKYLIVTERDYKYYSAYFPEFVSYSLYNTIDYNHLCVDDGLHYMYSNGGFGVYGIF